MQKLKQTIKLPIFLVMAVVLASLFTINASAFDFLIEEVTINEITVVNNYKGGEADRHFVAEAGDTLFITVKLDAFVDVDDVNIEAEIRGVETGTIDAETPLFDVKTGKMYAKFLTLKIPANIKLGDDITKDFTLRIRASSTDAEDKEEITLTIDRPRHSILVLDAQGPLNPVDAGKTALIEVAVRNRGSKVEEDIYVKAVIAELGTSRQKYLGDLAPLESDEDSLYIDFDEDLTDKAVAYIRLAIPEDAVSGTYNAQVIAYSLDGIIRAEDTVAITVEGATAGIPADTESVVSVDSAFKTVGKGQGVVYKVIVSNVGAATQVYTAQAAGVNFGTSRVDPTVLTLAPGASGEFNVFVSPAETSALGTYPFSVVVRAGSEEVTALNLNAQVTERTAGSDRLRQNLIVIAVILVAILIVLAIIIAITTGRRHEEAEEKLY